MASILFICTLILAVNVVVFALYQTELLMWKMTPKKIDKFSLSVSIFLLHESKRFQITLVLLADKVDLSMIKLVFSDKLGYQQINKVYLC